MQYLNGKVKRAKCWETYLNFFQETFLLELFWHSRIDWLQLWLCSSFHPSESESAMAACFEDCLLKFSPAALCYRLRSRTKVFCYPLCFGESLWLVFLIFVAEEELDFGCFSFRGEAMKPSRLTRGFLSLDVNSYSRRVFCFFTFLLRFVFYDIWFFCFF